MSKVNNTSIVSEADSLVYLNLFNQYNSASNTEADAMLILEEAEELTGIRSEYLEKALDKAKSFQQFMQLVVALRNVKAGSSVTAEVAKFTKSFMTDAPAVRAATQQVIDADPIRACVESGRHLADPEDQVAIRGKDVELAHQLFFDAVTAIGEYADRVAEVNAAHRAQLELAKSMGMDISSIVAEVQAEIEAAVAEGANEVVEGQFNRDPQFDKDRIELSRKIAKSGVEPAAVYAGLLHKAVKGRVQANTARTDRRLSYEVANRIATEGVRSVKVAASVLNTGARRVTDNFARAIAAYRFATGEFHESFKYEHREFTIDKAPDATIPEGLWSDNDLLAGMTDDTLYAIFDEWKRVVMPTVFGVMEQRRTVGMRGIYTFVAPIDAVALEFHTSRSSKDGFFNEYEYREYSLEDRIEEELLRLKVAFALQARDQEFAGSDDHHEGYLDW